MYLSIHHHQTRLGLLDSQSVCNISQKFNCDFAAASPYSEIFGWPIAVFAVVFYDFVLILNSTLILNLSSRTSTLLHTLWGLGIFNIAMSLIMGGISLFLLKTYCPFCILAYVLSILLGFSVWGAVATSGEDLFLSQTLGDLFKEQKWVTITGAVLIFIGGPVLNRMLVDEMGFGKLDKLIHQSVEDWKVNPVYQFKLDQGLVMGPREAKVAVVEFADYLCPHCKMASPSLKAFVKSNTDVQLIFKSFPLDKKCNDAIQVEGDGLRCELAYAVLCAQQISGKGWEMQDIVFSKQSSWTSTSFKSEMPGHWKDLSLDEAQMNSCLKAEETKKSIMAQAQEGVTAKISGTPTIFVNGQRLPSAQVLGVLRAARASLQ